MFSLIYIEPTQQLHISYCIGLVPGAISITLSEHACPALGRSLPSVSVHTIRKYLGLICSLVTSRLRTKHNFTKPSQTRPLKPPHHRAPHQVPLPAAFGLSLAPGSTTTTRQCPAAALDTSTHVHTSYLCCRPGWEH